MRWLARPGQPREGAAVDGAGNGGDEPPWDLTPSRAELRDWDFRERAARLMGDYESSYDADRAEYSYDGDFGELDRYPEYGSSAQAAEAIGRYRAAAASASAALEAAEARESAVIERLSQARAALDKTWPWQRHRRTGLRTLIEDAEEDLWALGGEAGFLALDVIRSDQLRCDAEWAAPLLSRRERARASADGAVTRTLGWRPGDALPGGCGVFRAGPDGIEAPRAAACLQRVARTEVAPSTAAVSALAGVPVSQPRPDPPPGPLVLPLPGQQPGPGPDPGGLRPPEHRM